MSKIVCIIIFCFSFVIAEGQELIFEKPENLKNLPSQETYHCAQDKDGYIWFCTESGLCKYNGETVKVFGRKEGLPEKACYGIAADSKGNIWVITSKNRILEVRNDTIREIPVTEDFAKKVSVYRSVARIFFLLNDSTAYINTSASGAYEVNLVRNSFKSLIRTETSDLFELRILNDNVEIIEEHKRDEFYSAKEYFKRKAIMIGVEWNRGKSITREMSYNSSFTPVASAYPIVNKLGEIICSYGPYLTKFKKNGAVETITLKDIVLCVYGDSNNGLWVGLRSGGVLYFPDSDLNGENISYNLKGYSVSGVLEDREGGFWFTTIEGGVFYTKSNCLFKLFDANNSLKKNFFFKSWKGSVFLFNGGDAFYELKNGRMINHQINHVDINFVTDFQCINEKWYLVGKNATAVLNKDFRKIESLKISYDKFQIPTINEFIDKGNGELLGWYYSEIIDIKNGLAKPREVDEKERFVGATKLNNNQILIYTKSKIFLDNSENRSLDELSRINNIQRVIPYGDNGYLVLTEEGKLLEGAGSALKQTVNYDTTEIDFLDLVFGKNDVIWFATNQGVMKMNYNDPLHHLDRMKSKEGFPVERINRVEISGNAVLFSTASALYKYIPDKFLSKGTNNVSIIPVSVMVDNLQKIDELPHLYLDYNQTGVELTFDVLNFKNRSWSSNLLYKLESYDKQFRNSVKNKIDLTNLPYGEYPLLIKAIDNDGNVISDSIKVDITVEKPYWQKWPFLILAIVIIIAMTILISAQIIKRIRRRETEKTRVNKMLADYRMSALRAQMNPHFIFNCINSIQRYVLTNKTQNAYDYLAKFSKLIREVLNLSEENMIPLRQELEIVELYMQMEQVRYEGYFDYEITIDEKIDTSEVFIPSLLLQPYIENGIWHGIMNLKKSRQGKIKLEVAPHGDDLQVVIEDNGVGREAAAKQKLAGHKSKALGINKQRMELVEEMNKGVKASITITDLFDENHQPSGTRVVIIIPQALGDE